MSSSAFYPFKQRAQPHQALAVQHQQNQCHRQPLPPPPTTSAGPANGYIDYFSLEDEDQIEQIRSILSRLQTKILYSDRYEDDAFEYRHVILPKEYLHFLPRGRLMSEEEWRAVGVRQSVGWVHYMIHKPEPNILMFRRPLPSTPGQT